MIRKILLIRHAQPAFPGGTHLCLGRRTDLNIGQEGRYESERLHKEIADIIEKERIIYTSPLKRAYMTAEILAGAEAEIIIEEQLVEMDTGEWDGLDFDTIRDKYPGHFAQRKDDQSFPPPGGDGFEDAAERMKRTLIRLVEKHNGDTLIAVAHSGINRAFLCSILGISFKDNRRIPQEYASYNRIYIDTEKQQFFCRLEDCGITAL